MEEKAKEVHRKKKEVTLSGIFGENGLEDLLEKMTDAIGMSFFVIDYRGQVVTERMVRDAYCKSGEKGQSLACRECLISSAFAAAKAAIQCCPFLFRCPNNLVSMALPIIVNDQYLGAVIGGRVRCPDAEAFPLLADENDSIKPAGDDPLFETIPEYSKEKFTAVSELLFMLLKEIGEKETEELQIIAAERNEIHLKDMRSRTDRLQKNLDEALYNNCKAKLLPQFLMNLFVTVSNFSILEKAEKTESVIADLASVFRYYVDNETDLVPLNTELEQVERYVKTLREQYGNRLEYEISCGEEAGRKRIPVLSVFPCVSYLLNNGVLPGHFKGKIVIEGQENDDKLNLTVRLQSSEYLFSEERIKSREMIDSDEGMLTEQMENTKKRFQYLYKDDYTLQVTPNAVRMTLPV